MLNRINAIKCLHTRLKSIENGLESYKNRPTNLYLSTYAIVQRIVKDLLSDLLHYFMKYPVC